MASTAHHGWKTPFLTANPALCLAFLWSRELGKISNLDMTNSTSWQPSDIMNADSGNEADSTASPKRQRGRIPQSAWSRILQRYRAGATLSAIAREFDCTPSAISYIVRKAEATATDPAASEEMPPLAEEPSPPPLTAAPQPVTAPPPPAVAPRASSTITTLSLPDRGSSQPRTSTLSLTPPTAAPPPPAPPPVVVAPSPPPPSPAVAASRPPVPDATRPGAAESGSAKATQPPPVDAIEARLRETARGCLVAYRGWRQAPGETSVQTLNDAVHELRKVLARVEIDISASRREEPSVRPIPVPAHRAARQQQRS